MTTSALNYTAPQIKLAARRDFTCNPRKIYKVENFNYPSFAVPVDTASGIGGGSKAPTTVQYTRILIIVGTPATYKVSVTSQSPSVKIFVQPQIRSFKALQEHREDEEDADFQASSDCSAAFSLWYTCHSRKENKAHQKDIHNSHGQVQYAGKLQRSPPLV